MLTIRNLFFALSLSPLLALAWQLPNQAQNASPGTAGTNSGASTGVSQTSVVSNPPVTPTGVTTSFIIVPGVSSSITAGASTTGELSASSTKMTVSTATVESNSSSVTVTNSATGNSVVVTLPTQVQVAVNQLATTIIQTLSTIDGARSQQVAASLTNSFTAAGISPQLSTALVTPLTGLFGSTKASLSNLPIALATPGQLVASNKALKSILVTTQSGAAINVDINKLNDAIVAYNGIILTSEAEDLRKLYKDTDFVGIGKVLQELRTSIQ